MYVVVLVVAIRVIIGTASIVTVTVVCRCGVCGKERKGGKREGKAGMSTF